MISLSTDGAPPTEASRRAHKEHGLRLVRTGQDKFKCDGCQEHGAGDKYRCPEPACDFDLHEACNLEKGTPFKHPLLQRTFEFRYEAPLRDRLCDACGAKVLGSHYHCSGEDLDLHPCCAKLPPTRRLGDLEFELRKEASYSHRCNHCRGRGGYGKFWFYRSTCKSKSKTVYLHVRCVKEEVLLQMQKGASGSSSSSTTTGTELQTHGRENLDLTKIIEAFARIVVAAMISGDPKAAVIDALLPAVTRLFFDSTE